LKKFDREEIEAAVDKLTLPTSSSSTSSTTSSATTTNSLSPSISGVQYYIDNDLKDYVVGRGDSLDTSIRFINTFTPKQSKSNPNPNPPTKEDISRKIESMATDLDVRALAPIGISMLLIGSCVGMITPIMPYIVANLQLTASEFGYVVSAFGLAKNHFFSHLQKIISTYPPC